jgi:hypothetical protein
MFKIASKRSLGQKDFDFRNSLL